MYSICIACLFGKHLLLITLCEKLFSLNSLLQREKLSALMQQLEKFSLGLLTENVALSLFKIEVNHNGD